MILKKLSLMAKLFFTEKEGRLQRLIDRISLDFKHDKSEFDFSEDSLVVIDRWLASHVESVKLSEEEYDS